jgi:hypothetical protein
MNPRLFLPALLAASLANAQSAAPDAAPAKAENPPAAAAEAKTEMQKWIATTDEQWQAAFKRDVTDMHEAEAKKLMLQYLTSLEEGIRKASGASDLDGAVALRNEQKRFGESQAFPEQDEAADAPAVKQIRAAIRTQLARLEKDRATRAAALHAKYDQFLAQAQSQLTQRQRLDDALLLKNKREEVAAAWLTPGAAAVAKAPAVAPETPATSVAKVPFGTKAPPRLAKVEAEDTVMAPLTVGEQLLSDARKVQWAAIPDSLEGFAFTKIREHNPTLRFKVLTDGLVYMACTDRFSPGNSKDEWKKEVITEAGLHTKGWHRERGFDLKASNDNGFWWVYSRACKAGEAFTYRTEHYRSPILLVKLSEAAAPAVPVSAAVPPKPPALTPVEPPKALPAPRATMTPIGTIRTADATKDRPFENSLGMKFVPVPMTGGPGEGSRLLFSIWETRVQDYGAFVKAKHVEWPKPPFPQGPTHPAVNVSRRDAQAFCAWLTEHERKAGRLGTTESYRLPTDHEWSCAVGIGGQEDPAQAPDKKHNKLPDVFPWGTGYPPPNAKMGNYADTAFHEKTPKDPWLEGYTDDYAATAPVGSFPCNDYGMFDLGGNAMEWCEELLNPESNSGVLRGGSWSNSARHHLVSSSRYGTTPDYRHPRNGFRVVLSGTVPAR